MLKIPRNFSICLIFLFLVVFLIYGCGKSKFQDIIPPTVASISPNLAATNVALDSQISVTFSEAMNYSTVDAPAFSIASPLGGVAGTVAYDNSQKIFTFSPVFNLYSNNTHTVTIAATVKDLAGNSMGSSYTWNFTTTTSSVPSWASIAGYLNGKVHALAFDSLGNLYAGGEFTTAGGTTVNYIAKWDGSSWSTLGTGMNNTVYALAIDSSNNVYAGGHFTTAGGTTVNRIAKWDGSSWSAVGRGIDDGIVYCLEFDSSGNLYAGGSFGTIYGIQTYDGVAVWDGSDWNNFGTGINGFVYTLAVDSAGNVFAGGTFTVSLHGAPADYLAKWDGSSWSSIASGIDYPVFAIDLDSSGNLYVAGQFDNIAGITAYGIAKWNGTSWSKLGTGIDPGSSSFNPVFDMGFDSSGDLYVVGSFDDAGGVSAQHVAKWDGTAWATVGSGLVNTFYPYTLAIDSSDNLHTSGYRADGDNYIAKWFK